MLGSENAPQMPDASSKGEVDRLQQLQSNLEAINKEITEATIQADELKDSFAPGEEASALDGERPDEYFPLERTPESSASPHHTLAIDSLETLLKSCLFCLTIFPPNALIKKRLLIHWWMGEDIVKSTDEGKRSFDQMISEGLIVPVRNKHCDKVHYCRMDARIRKLLISHATSNAFLQFDPDGSPSNDYSKSHRACLRHRGDQTPFGGDSKDKLKTIYNIDRRYIDFEPTWLVNKRHLSTMQLGGWQEGNQRHRVEVKNGEFLEGLENCRRLKYISLRGISRVEKLPESTGKLNKLVVLDLRACHNLEKLPASIGSARRLQYLDVSECYLLDQMPKSLANLSELQVFKGFVVGDLKSKSICHLSDLAKLTKLRKLSINIDHEFVDEELQNLGNCKVLTTLIITWTVVVPQEQRPPSEAPQAPKQPPDHKQLSGDDDANKEGPEKPKQSSKADIVEEEDPLPEEQKPPTLSDVKEGDGNKKVSQDKQKGPANSDDMGEVSQGTSGADGNKKEVSTTDNSRASEHPYRTKKLESILPRMMPIMKKPPSSASLPPSVEKLDLRCFPGTEFPPWIGPSRLTNLKKLYLRGGMLRGLGEGKDWRVEVLRVRYLKHLDHPWSSLRTWFPHLRIVEKSECGRVSSWPCDEKRLWSKGREAENAAGAGGGAGSSAPTVEDLVYPSISAMKSQP